MTPRALLNRVLERLGFELDEHDSDTLRPHERLKILHELRLDARACLRVKGEQLRKFLERENATPAAGVPKAISDRVRKFIEKFVKGVRKLLKSAFVAAALAMLGPGELTTEEKHAIEQALNVQAGYLEKFRVDLITQKQPLDGRLPARVESYGGSVWAAGTNLTREVARNTSIFTEEQRIHVGPRTKNDPCNVCATEENKLWQPIGTLRVIGDSPCESNCHCHYIFRTAKGEEWICGRGPLSESAFGYMG